MSFGFGVSDFLTVIELASKIRKEFAGAPSQFKEISDEVRSLSIILQDVEVVLLEQDLSSQQNTELQNIAHGCRSVLNKLEKTLDKYSELGSVHAGVGKRVKRAWKRLKWEPEDIQELRSRVSSNIAMLNAFNGHLTRDNTVKLVQYQDNQERRTILDWLTPIDYGTQQSDFINRRQEGTGQWLLELDKFKEWVNGNMQTLFCPGIPGTGKTIITSIVVEHLYAKFRDDPNIGIAYLYCNFRRQQEQRPADLLTNLLKQLVQRRFSVPGNVKNLYRRHSYERTRPSFDEISKMLHSIVTEYSKTFIIVDALDECRISDGGCGRLLSEIFNLQANCNASFFATSRFIPEIMKEFKESIIFEIRASDSDVQKYLDEKMPRLRPFVLRNLALQKEIKSDIIKAVDGMFLLAQLYLDSLVDKTTPKAIRLALKIFRKESEASNDKKSEALDHAYTQAMERIEGQEAGFEELAKKVLAWIICAKRPLTTLELRHAFAVEVGESKIDEENLPEIEDTVSMCAGLVTLDEQSDIIRLVHYTTQQYFERTQMSWFPDAHRDMATTCITYLSFDIFETGFCLTDEEFKTRLQLNSLYDYAARYWGYHVCAALTDLEQLILGFFKSEAKVSASSQAMMASNEYRYYGYSQNVPKQMTGVHLAAYFGLTDMTATLLKNGYFSDSEDTYSQTPLWWAAANGQEAVVRLLVDRADVEVDSKNNSGSTSLSRAARHGHEAVVRLLVDRADVKVDSKNKSGKTPLSCAAVNGHEAVIRLLVDRADVEVDSKDYSGKTPLSCAAIHGHEAVVRLLVDRGDVEADSKDNSGRTPLLWAAVYGHEAVTRLLVDRADVEADSKDNSGRTSLSWAAGRGHEAVVRLLVDRADVEADSKDNSGRTPLSWAARRGHEAVVRLLVDRADAEANLKDNSGQTPLSWAAVNGHEPVVKLLKPKTASCS